jgi:hypothetical protein
VLLGDGGFLIASGIHIGNDGGLLFRVAANGDLLWHRIYLIYLDNLNSASVDTLTTGGYIWALTADNHFTVVKLGSDTTSAVTSRFMASPDAFDIQTYPNPFNSSTEIAFSLPRTMDVALRVYDVLGKEVAVLADGKMTAGEHEVVFNGQELPSGVYFCRMEAEEGLRVKKMVLLK